MCLCIGWIQNKVLKFSSETLDNEQNHYEWRDKVYLRLGILFYLTFKSFNFILNVDQELFVRLGTQSNVLEDPLCTWLGGCVPEGQPRCWLWKWWSRFACYLLAGGQMWVFTLQWNLIQHLPPSTKHKENSPLKSYIWKCIQVY